MRIGIDLTKNMRIGIDLNGVLRDTLGKIEQVYDKFYVSNEEGESDFKYEINYPIDSLNLMNHFKFENSEDLYNFLYVEHPMEIFGHAASVEYTGMNDLNDFYLDMRDNYKIIIISDEIGKSKPATLFFLSKFSCLIENIMFYSEQTKNNMLGSIDVLLTANPDLLLKEVDGLKVIKYEQEYNKNIKAKYSINKLKELKDKILEIC
jgi:hypothetical protein